MTDTTHTRPKPIAPIPTAAENAPRDRHPTAAQVADRVERLIEIDRARYRRLWAYCRNPMRPCAEAGGDSSHRPYRQAQEWGLPSRITGVRRSATELFAGEATDELARKEGGIATDLGG